MPVNNIAKRVRFLGLDGLMVAPLLLIMLYPRMMTLYLLLGVAIMLFFVERRGLSVLMLFRRIRVWMIGRHRFIRPPGRKQM